LVAIGFQPRGDGSLTTPGHIVLAREGDFYRVSIELPNGDALVCHVARIAFKVRPMEN